MVDGGRTPLTAAAGTIYTFNPSAKNPPNATIFASGVPGANSIAFDKKGNLWVSDGITVQGRVWKIMDRGPTVLPRQRLTVKRFFVSSRWRTQSISMLMESAV